MAGPETPGQAGPSDPPPPLPEGWIAQWDGMSRKYYFVQMSSGISQWDVPVHAAPTVPTPGGTPQQHDEHPYGQPPNGADIITNADGSQSIRHPDGRIEPYNGERGLESDRGLGSTVMNQLLSGNKHSNQSSSGLGGLASSLLGGSSSSNHGSSSGGGSAANIVGALASNFLGGGKKTNTNYSGQQQSHSSGGLLGGILGGSHGGSSNQQSNYGYSNNHSGGYSGSAPPVAYNPGNPTPSHQGHHQPDYNSPAHSTQPHNYNTPPPNQPHQPDYNNPQSHQGFGGGYNPSPQPNYAPQGGPQNHQYGGPPGPHNSYGNPSPYGGQPSYAPPPNYGGPQGHGGHQPYEMHGGAPPPPMGSHPHHGGPHGGPHGGHHGGQHGGYY